MHVLRLSGETPALLGWTRSVSLLMLREKQWTSFNALPVPPVESAQAEWEVEQKGKVNNYRNMPLQMKTVRSVERSQTKEL